jgi:hypothetical protein
MDDDRMTRAAREILDKAGTAQGIQEGFTSAIENVCDLNVRLIDMARANTEAAFDFAHEIASAKAPSDVVQAWSTHSKKQFEMLTKQAGELTSMAQRFASTTTEPVAGAPRRG